MNDLILENKIDCLFLSETWLNTNTPVFLTKASPPDITFLYSIRTDIKGGGTASITLNSLSSKEIVLPPGDIIRRHGVNFHSFADDTQLYIVVSPEDTSPLDKLNNCILDIKSWMAENFLHLIQDKTEVLIIGLEAMREKLLARLYNLKPSQCGPGPHL